MGVLNDIIEKVNRLTTEVEVLRAASSRDRANGQKEERFWASITAVDGSGNYSWTKQYFDGNGAFTAHQDGRTGTPTNCPAKENNGATLSVFPFYAELTRRVELVATTQVVYGFDASASIGATEYKGLTFTSDTASTADSDPGNGKFRWNNATQGSATVLYFDNQTADAVSNTTFFGSLGSSGFIHLQQYSDSTKWQTWKWTALPVAGVGYYKFTVTLQQNAGSIADGKIVLVEFDDTAGSGSAHNVLSATHTDSTPASVVKGDMIAGGTTPTWARLPGPTTPAQMHILTSTPSGGVAAVPAWVTFVPEEVVGVAMWRKFTVAYTDIAVAAASTEFVLDEFPAKTVVHDVRAHHTVRFTDGVNHYNCSMGVEMDVPAGFDDIMAAYLVSDVPLSTGPFEGGDNSPPSIVVPKMGDGFAAFDIHAAFAIGTGNLNALTQGSVDIYIYYSVMP